MLSSAYILTHTHILIREMSTLTPFVVHCSKCQAKNIYSTTSLHKIFFCSSLSGWKNEIQNSILFIFISHYVRYRVYRFCQKKREEIKVKFVLIIAKQSPHTLNAHKNYRIASQSLISSLIVRKRCRKKKSGMKLYCSNIVNF